MFSGKGVLKICTKLTGEHPYRTWISPVNLLHIFKTPFPKNTSGGCFWNWKTYGDWGPSTNGTASLSTNVPNPRRKFLVISLILLAIKENTQNYILKGVLKSNCCATLSLKYKSLSYDAQVLTRFSWYIQELLIIWDLYLAERKALI